MVDAGVDHQPHRAPHLVAQLAEPFVGGAVDPHLLAQVLGIEPPALAEAGEIDGLYLGGGFPEDCAADLSASPHLRTLAAWAGAGLPIYAECGGFMLLAQGIEREGVLWPFSNIFPVVAQFCGLPQGLGYVHGTVVEENPFFPKGLEILGHEFHYSRCCWQGAAAPPVRALAARVWRRVAGCRRCKRRQEAAWVEAVGSGEIWQPISQMAPCLMIT